jgi:hypothetical protein
MRARQKDFERIGAEGCYFLSIIAAAERYNGSYIDAYDAYTKALDKKIMDENCYMIAPDVLLSDLTGRKWIVRKEPLGYQPNLGEVVIYRYERVEGMKTWAHFVLAGEDNSVEYDPYGKSLTVERGHIVSKRVFRRV